MKIDDKRLLTSQKNEIFHAIETMDLNPNNFVWIEEKELQSDYSHRLFSKLAYQNSRFFYTFDYLASNKYMCECCPGRHAVTDHEYFEIWSGVGDDLARWLHRIKREISEPDLWAETQRYIALFSPDFREKVQDIPFTEVEATQIKDVLKGVEDKIKNDFSLLEDQLVFVKNEISYLKLKASEGFSKKDWFNLLFSTIINICLALSLSPEKASQIYLFFKEALNPIIMKLLG